MEFNPSDAADQPTGPRLLEPGTYELTVREAEERVSSKGNPMIALELEPDGHAGMVIREYLVATQAAMFKIKQFCEAAGLMEKFNAGRLTEADCRNIRVKAKLTIEEGTDGYPDKNRVDEFLKAGGIPTMPDGGGQHAPAGGGGGHQPLDDADIPF